ncbi:MAG: hypothetical protein KTR18_15880 [Acidiferrobacterales bacterium]|nr:hypothetical protein [Acidiferrobacterales bacterium]
MFSLANVMRLNAASCLLFGLIFVVFSSEVAIFLDPEKSVPYLALIVIGIGLIINGADLIRVSLQPSPSKFQVRYFAVGDFIWVLVSIGLIVLDIWIVTKEGVITTIVIAIMVGIFGVLQWSKSHALVSQ